MILREVAHRHFMAPLGRARVRETRLDDGAQHGRLPRPVAAHQRDLLAAADAGGEIRDDLGIVVSLRQSLDFERMASRRALHFKSDEGARDVGAGQIRSLQALDFLSARGHLRRARAGREALDEFVQLLDLLLALCVLRFDAGTNLGLLQHHVVVAAGVGDDGLVVDIGDVRADFVEEVAVMRDDDQAAVVANQVILQPVD